MRPQTKKNEFFFFYLGVLLHSGKNKYYVYTYTYVYNYIYSRPRRVRRSFEYMRELIKGTKITPNKLGPRSCVREPKPTNSKTKYDTLNQSKCRRQMKKKLDSKFINRVASKGTRSERVFVEYNLPAREE